MFNIAEYKRRPNTLADRLPWAALIAPGVILGKDGSFQATVLYRGRDVESATPAELVAYTAMINNAIRRLGSGWALFWEARRLDAHEYPTSSFPDRVTWLIDQERRGLFLEEGAHLESAYYLTLVYMPPEEYKRRFMDWLIERPANHQQTDYRQHIDYFLKTVHQVVDLLTSVFPEARIASDEETLTYLHAAISTKRHPIAVPEAPIYLDALLPDEPLACGLDPRLGDTWLRPITIRGFPGSSYPAMLEEMNRLGLEYRWTTRFIPEDKGAAGKLLETYQRQWFSKRKSLFALLREVFTKESSPLMNPEADAKAADAGEAMAVLGEDAATFGYFTSTVVLADRDQARLAEKVRAVEAVINNKGFVTVAEQENAVEAWLGSLPGHCYANVRMPVLHTLNLVRLAPMTAVWAGPHRHPHFDGPPLLFATTGTTPFRLVNHVGDVGHTWIGGPTGAGKSVFLALMAAQWRRYAGARVIIFDKGRSARALTLAVGGDHYTLSTDNGRSQLAFQPLARVDEPAEAAWAHDWLQSLIAKAGVSVTPAHRNHLWEALGGLASAPAPQRTFSGLRALVQSAELKNVFDAYAAEGPLGPMFDADSESLAVTDFTTFEMEDVMRTPSAVFPVLTYLFHRLEELYADRRPTLCVLDEAWLFLDDPIFAPKLREWLKTLRKYNVSMVFATQSLADVANSTIAPAIVESCPVRILLPNDKALEPQIAKVYRQFGLSDRQIELISTATPKRHYYYTSPVGNRLFTLGLGPVALAFCGAGADDDQKLIDRLANDAGDFAAAWLRAKGLNWAADYLQQNQPETEDAL